MDSERMALQGGEWKDEYIMCRERHGPQFVLRPSKAMAAATGQLWGSWIVGEEAGVHEGPI